MGSQSDSTTLLIIGTPTKRLAARTVSTGACPTAQSTARPSHSAATPASHHAFACCWNVTLRAVKYCAPWSNTGPCREARVEDLGIRVEIAAAAGGQLR